jgi:hypothetical protein
VNDDDALARRRAAMVATRARSRAASFAFARDVMANFVRYEKCPWNGHFSTTSFRIAIACARARAPRARARRDRVATLNANSIAPKIFLHRTRARALATTKSRFERANRCEVIRARDGSRARLRHRTSLCARPRRSLNASAAII